MLKKHKNLFTYLISCTDLAQQEWVTFVICSVDHQTHQTDHGGQNYGQGQAEVQRPVREELSTP